MAGLRYEKDEQELTNNVTRQHLEESWDGVTPKFAVKYRIMPDIMTYISASKGYRSGGFNIIPDMDSAYRTYDQEKLWSYEIGIKGALLDHRLILNGAVYYMDIDDMQVDEAISPYQNYTTNAAEATGKGVELEMTARITRSWALMAGFGYSDVEFDKSSDALGLQGK